MIETDSLALMAEKVSGFFSAEVAINIDTLEVKKRRTIEAQKTSNLYVSWSLDLTVSFRLFSDSREAVNEAVVFLLPEELPIFTQALMQHPILFPTNYSQHLSMERGMYCIRLKSQEPSEGFAERLSEALYVLG